MNRFVLLFLLIISALTTKAQQYRNLVMEGGGTKGIAYGGALQELENRGQLNSIVRVAGTSAGAIQACLLSIGYTPAEIMEIINKTPVESFNDDGFIPKAAKRLQKEYGWFRGDSFLKTIEDLIYNRTGNRDLTFSELHGLAKSYPFRDLYVTGVNLSTQSLTIFSFESYPNMRVADAVRVSMSIPLYYRGIWLNPVGKVFEEYSPTCNCGLYVDGGLLMNYPIEIFDDSKYMDSIPSKPQFNNQTLGMRLERCVQIDHELGGHQGLAPHEITDLGSYMGALSSIIMRNISPLKPEDLERTIFINDLGLSARVRKVPEEEQKRMITAGQQGVIEFFERKAN